MPINKEKEFEEYIKDIYSILNDIKNNNNEMENK